MNQDEKLDLLIEKFGSMEGRMVPIEGRMTSMEGHGIDDCPGYALRARGNFHCAAGIVNDRSSI